MNKKLTLTFLAGLTALAGCNSSPPVASSSPTNSAPANDITINIIFDGNKCPVGVDKTPSVPQTWAKKINWQAVTSALVPDNQDYEIFFDPFKGKSIESKGQSGATNGIKLDSTVPANVMFKYTIVGADCPTNPLDPRIIIY